jgi:hypothetical protein
VFRPEVVKDEPEEDDLAWAKRFAAGGEA